MGFHKPKENDVTDGREMGGKSHGFKRKCRKKLKTRKEKKVKAPQNRGQLGVQFLSGIVVVSGVKLKK